MLWRTLWRVLVRNKAFTLINVLGLSVGFAGFLLIVLFVRDELSFDRHYENAERIYRLSRDVRPGDGSPDFRLAANGPLEAALLKQDFPQIEEVARLRAWRAPLTRGELQALEQGAFVDSSFVDVFDFEWLAGAPEQALEAPGSLVLSASLAEKYFPGEDALGGTLLLEGRYPVQVRGVVGDLPHNTHLRFDLLISMPTAELVLGPTALLNPSTSEYHSYALLREGADIGEIQSQVPNFFERHYGEGTSAIFGLTVTPLTDIHLRSRREGELSPVGSMSNVYGFSLIAAVVLLVACFNFMNLATAQATARSREVGVRKVMGAARSQMLKRFLGESLLLSLLSMCVAIVLVELLLPAFNAFSLREMEIGYGSDRTLAFLFVVTLLVGLIAGSYPAFYLSAFHPARVLKGGAAATKSALVLRNVLVTLQFTIAIILLVGTVTVFLQLRYARGIELGYDKEHIVVLDSAGREGLGAQWDAVKQALLAHPGIAAVSASNVVPGSRVATNYFVRAEGAAATRTMPVMLVDHGFFETYGIDILAGESLSPLLTGSGSQPVTRTGSGGERAYVLNELAARQLGWTPQEALGKSFEVNCCGFGSGRVVGVARDVYFEAVQVPQSPLVYLIPPEPEGVIHRETRLGLQQASIRIDGSKVPQSLAHIRDTWSDFFPNSPLDLRFLQEDFDALYLQEERQHEMLLAFTALAIVIACLGLYGLASFMGERRTREIGVRKALGGSAWSIVLLLTRDFSKLVLLANLLAWPIAYFTMSRWLEHFAYRIDLSPLIFIGSGAIALCIAWATVGGTAAKAASARPVLALRYE